MYYFTILLPILYTVLNPRVNWEPYPLRFLWGYTREWELYSSSPCSYDRFKSESIKTRLCSYDRVSLEASTQASLDRTYV